MADVSSSWVIQQRRDTAANWTGLNPALHQGEIGLETDTGKAKIGDGVTAWNSLSYWNPGGSGGGSVTSVTATDASIVVSGTATAPTVATGTLDKIASLHPPILALAMNSQKITGLANGTATTDAAAFGQTPAGGNTATVAQGGTGQITQQAAINALTGTQSAGKVLRSDGTNATLAAIQAGDLPATSTVLSLTFTFGTSGAIPSSGTYSTGQVAVDQTNVIRVCTAGGTPGTWLRAGQLPSQFYVDDYGAKGDGKIVSDATMAVTSPNLACITSTPFTSTAVDGGKKIVVQNAGTSGLPLVTTISTVTDSGHAVLAANSVGAVTSVGCVFGTDDTAAIQAAINAAVAYASAGPGYGEVIFSTRFYIVAGAAVIGGTTLGNSQITLPNIVAGAVQKVTLTLRGLQSASTPGPHWLQTSPSRAGATLISIGQGTLDGTYGPGCVIGGPYFGFGGGGGTFSNLCVVIDGLTVSPVFYAQGFGTGVVAQGPGFGGINLFGVGQAVVKSYSFLPLGVTVTTSTTWPYYKGPEAWTGTQWQPGLVMPAVGNNDLADIWQYTGYGAWTTLVASEHCNVQAIRALNCGRMLNLQGGGGGGPASHGIEILYASCEATGVPVSGETAGYYKLVGPIGVKIEKLELETYDANEVIFDQGGFLSGNIWFNDLATPGYRSGGLIQAPLGTGIKLIQENVFFGPVASPQAPPATNVAWPNYYYRDAWITLSVSSGNITAVKIDSTAQAIPASATTYSFLLPSGHSYTPTYSVPSSLTHTVTLL